MEALIEILNGINPDVDYDTCENLIDGHYLDSLAILSLIAELEEEFEITISTIEIIPSNFNSVKNIYEMILRLQEDQ